MTAGAWRATVASVGAALLAATGTGCGASRTTAAVGYSGQLAVVNVPRDAPTIGAAVARVRPGGTILIAPGTYRESVTVDKPRVVLRGLDRDRVVVDGQWQRDNGIVVTAPGVSVENLTVHGYNLSGVLVTGEADGGVGIGRGSDGYQTLDPAKYPPLDGFRVRYVTSYNNGLYGIYAFDAQHGVIEHTYTSGGADSGLYVGQCKPCDIVVRDNIAERNAVGLEADNASRQLYLVTNRLVGNRVGLTVGSDYQEALIPQQAATVVGNLVADNDRPDTPEQADGGYGIGVGIGGGSDDLVARNRITGNPTAGLVIGSYEDLPPVGDTVDANVFGGNGVDVGYAASQRAPGQNDCLSGNQLRSVVPQLALGGCVSGPGADLGQPPAPPGISFHDVSAPPPQADLPPGTPVQPAVGLPGRPAVADIGVPGTGLWADGSAIRL